MSHAWFVFKNNVVSGPFQTEQIREQVQSEQIPNTAFIWCKGQREWIPAWNWEAQLVNLSDGAASFSTPTQPSWYYDAGASTHGPMSQAELIQQLKSSTDLNRTRVWAVGMPRWTSLFEVPELMEQLGMNHREHPRAPLLGSVVISKASEDAQSTLMKASSISVGGLGLRGAHSFQKGDLVNLVVKASELSGPIHIQGEIVYTTKSECTGIRFSKIHPETQSIIFDYVKRFHAEQDATQAA